MERIGGFLFEGWT